MPLYAKWHNTGLPWITDSQMKNWMNFRKVQAALFGQKIVIDLGFESSMSRRGVINMTEQIAELYGMVSKEDETFDLTFCNLRKDSETFNYLKFNINNLTEPENLTTLEERHYLDIFP